MRAILFIISLFVVLVAPGMARAQDGGKIRNYFVAAEDVIWDYAPSGRNLITDQPFTEQQAYVMEASDTRMGRRFKKALYFEYTDDTFTRRVERSKEWEHLGWLGPLIRAEVGDTIRIVFRNNTSFPASMHPHGVFYDKDSEGAPYQDGTSGAMKADDGVPPGGTHVYTWVVPERAGPVPGGASTAFWMYHSHTDETRDFNTGLVGPMLITARGRTTGDDLRPDDVDREFIIAFMSTEEASSQYVLDNIKANLGKPEGVRIVHDEFGGMRVSTGKDATLEVRDNMNGFMFGNMPLPVMHKGERVRWYLMAGTGFEVHAPHWHGNVGVEGHMRLDVVALTTMGMSMIDMVPDDPGTWLFHCHVGAHADSGMIARYQVLP